MAKIVYSGSDRALRAWKIKHRDIAIPVAYEGSVGTGTNYLSDVVNGRDDGAVIVGLITGTSDLNEFVLLVDKESIAGEIISDSLSLFIDVREPNNVFSGLAQEIKSQRYVSSRELVGSAGAITDTDQSQAR
jgi:hypothetical protein